MFTTITRSHYIFKFWKLQHLQLTLVLSFVHEDVHGEWLVVMISL